MPKPHRDTMEVLFVFLKWVASFSHVDEETGSKMDLQNLATVISPNILYAKGKDPARDESFSAARAVHELLELQDDFWEVSCTSLFCSACTQADRQPSQVPTECLSILNDQELFANPSQLTSKEILARTENHLSGRVGNGRGGVSITRGEASPAQRPGLQGASSFCSRRLSLDSQSLLILQKLGPHQLYQECDQCRLMQPHLIATTKIDPSPFQHRTSHRPARTVLLYRLLPLGTSPSLLTVQTSHQLNDEELQKDSLLLNLLLGENTLTLPHLLNRTDNSILMYSSNSKISLFDSVESSPFLFSLESIYS